MCMQLSYMFQLLKFWSPNASLNNSQFSDLLSPILFAMLSSLAVARILLPHS